MVSKDKPVPVFGATGQQGGAVTEALHTAGWVVRALVRDPGSDKAQALAARGITTVQGDLADPAMLRSAMAGAYGVFSVQPSSGQGAAYGISDADEIRYGMAVADAAVEAGVRHLVYSSANAAGDTLTGIGHFDSKSAVERYIRTLPIPSTIVRPSAFMEILTLPGLGLESGTLTFFMRADQPMQFIAVKDIGRMVAAILAEPGQFASRTLEIAGDAVTGAQVADTFSRTAGRSIVYSRFPDTLLTDNAFLGSLASLVDAGRLAGNADIPALRRIIPDLLTLDGWLAGPGGALLRKAASAPAGAVALR